MPPPRILALIATFALTVAVYWAGLHGPLVFDDGANLEPINDWLRGSVGWKSVVFGNDSGLLGRSLSMASFLANVALLGPDPWGLKLGNLLIHLINGGLVFALYSVWIRRSAMIRGVDRPGPWMAWIGASVWLLHPLLASTVLYVVQRMAMLSALFILLAMLAYVYGRIAVEEQRRSSALVLLALVAPLCTVLAVLSKENGILAPALCAVIELLLFQPEPPISRNWKSKAFIWLALGLPAIVVVVLTIAQPPFIVAGFLVQPFTLSERLLTETRVVWDYVGDLLLPGGPQLGFYHDDIRISRSLFTPITTLFAIAGWFVALFAAWRLRDVIPGLALGLAIFLIGHSLESSIFPLMLYFEHRNYFPAIGAIWAVLGLISYCARLIRMRLRRAALVFSAAACVLLLVLAAGTYARAQVWSDQRSMIAQALLVHPDSPGARFDSITLSLAMNPPAFEQARRDADWMRHSTESSTRRIGAIERTLIECMAEAKVDPALADEIFQGPPGPFEEDLMRAFEILSDGIATHPCAGLSPGELADRLSGMLDVWERSRPNWRLRFRTANLYMASDRNEDAIKQGKLAYANGSTPTSTSIMIAGLLLYCGDTVSAANILDATESKLRPSDTLAKAIILDDRAKIRAEEQLRSQQNGAKQ